MLLKRVHCEKNLTTLAADNNVFILNSNLRNLIDIFHVKYFYFHGVLYWRANKYVCNYLEFIWISTNVIFQFLLFLPHQVAWYILVIYRNLINLINLINFTLLLLYCEIPPVVNTLPRNHCSKTRSLFPLKSTTFTQICPYTFGTMNIWGFRIVSTLMQQNWDSHSLSTKVFQITKA